MRTLIITALLAGARAGPRPGAHPLATGRRGLHHQSEERRHRAQPRDVVFGLKGMGIAPAGVKFDNTGHHHLLIDTAARRT